MKNKKKVFWNTVLFLTILGLTLYGVFHGEDMGEMKAALMQTKVWWLVPAAGCVFVFIWGESIIIWYMLRTYGIHIKEALCFLISSVGFFFSCVTPSATGGQPMQIYFMKKEKIPIPVSTVILMIVTITYKLVLVVVGVSILLFGRGFQEQYLTGILPIFYLGIALNVFCVSFMMILVFHPSLAKKMMICGLKLLEHLHFMKKKEMRLQRLEASMDMYNETAAFMKEHKLLMVNVFLITLGQRLALFAVTWFVCLAFSISGQSAITVILLQAVISVSVDMLPLPGGMGISETLFLAIFPPIFGELLLPAMVLSRGLGYYSELLISAIFTVVAMFVFDHREAKREKIQKRNQMPGNKQSVG